MSSASTTVMSGTRALPPVLGRLLSGTFWLALRVPLQVVFSLWTTRLILEAIKADQMGAYRFAWGFGFFQMLFEFGISSALQRQISDSWTRGDREGVDRAVACGLNFYTAMAVVQMIALLGVTYWALPRTAFHGESYDLIVKLLWLQIVTAPCYGLSVVVSSVLQAARRYDFIPRLEVAITILRFVVLVAGLKSGIDFLLGRRGPDRHPGLPVAGAWPLGDDSRSGPPASFSRGAAGGLQGAGAHQLLHGPDPDQRGAGRQG